MKFEWYRSLLLHCWGNEPKNTCRKALFKTGILGLTLAWTVGFALAQTPEELASKSLEDLMNIEVDSVYSASKYSQKVTEAPSSVSIVTSEQIQRYGYRSFGDILASVRGFYLTHDRNYTYVGVRGFARPGDYNTGVLLLIDGHRINDNIYDQALIGREFPVDVDLIERIEVVRGSSSSLYGTNAFFAVINVITKRGRDVKGVEVSGEVASLGTYQGRLTYGNRVTDNFEMMLSATHYKSRGNRQLFFTEFDTPETNNGIAVDADGEKSDSFLANISFRDFTLHATYGSRDKRVPTAPFLTVFNDRRTRTTDRRGYFDLQYAHTFANQLGIQARTAYDSYRYDGDYVYDLSLDGTPQLDINKDLSRGAWWSSELQLSKTMRNNRLTLGTEYRDNLKQNQGNYYLTIPIPVLDDKRKSKNFALFLQDEFTIRENLTFSAGARYDHSSIFGGTVKPRLALIYHPQPKTTVKLLYGEAFRAPNSFELYFFGTFFRTNTALKPETIKTGELVFEKYLGDHLRLSASGYVYRIKDLISQVTIPDTGETFFENKERVASKGLEFEMEGKGLAGLEGNLSYTIQDTKDQETGQGLTNSPRHLGKLNVIAPVLKGKIFAGFQFQYSSHRLTLNGTSLPPSYVSNLTLFSQKIVKGVEASFGAYNLFDAKYADPAAEEHRQNALDQNGRNLRLKLTYHF
jgi:outer membrane receptor for ferrienterochelin and colicins